MALSLHTPPSAPAITLAEAKAHLRVDVADEDTLITALVAAATQDAEHLMQRAVMPQKWRYTDDDFDPLICLRRPIVTAVDSVKYVDAAGTLQTLAPAAYSWAASDSVAELWPIYGTAWPAARYQPGAVEVVFSCGWADAANVPELVKAWIRLRLTALYEHRSAWTQGQAIERNEHIDFLLDRWRVHTL